MKNGRDALKTTEMDLIIFKYKCYQKNMLYAKFNLKEKMLTQ
jgi:hypothetical protein